MVLEGYNPMFKSGDIVVCVCKTWGDYTYGKQYIINQHQGSLIDIESDRGYSYHPSLTYTKMGVRGLYFIGLDKYREIEIEKIMGGRIGIINKI